MENNLLLAMLPTMHPSKSYIHLPVESKEQAIAVVKAYGITKFDDVYLTEFHPAVKEGNPYQVHICHSEFLDLLMTKGITHLDINAMADVTEYIPSAQEVADALADADRMNYNMRTYGTIDVPKENRIVLKDLRNSSKALRELAPTIIDENPPKFSVSAIGRGLTEPVLYFDLITYVLQYTDALGVDREFDFEAADDKAAFAIADAKCRNGDMLNSTGISLVKYQYGNGEPMANYSFSPDAINLKVYTLWYTDECHTDCEDEFEAPDDVMAMRMADIKCKGNEGLWTGISLTSSENDKELDYKPFG